MQYCATSDGEQEGQARGSLAGLDELLVARVVAPAQPAQAVACRLAGAALAYEALVLGDRRAEVEPRVLGEELGLELALEDAQLARCRACPALARAKRSHARANETKLVRPPQRWAASIGHTPPAGRLAPTMISLLRMPVSIASRVRTGRQSIARRRSSTGERARRIGFPASEGTPSPPR